MEVIKPTEICEIVLVSLRSCVVARLSRKSNKGAGLVALINISAKAAKPMPLYVEGGLDAGFAMESL